MANFADSNSVILKNVRLDYHDTFAPGEPMNAGGTPKYKVKAIIEPGSDAAKVAEAALLEAATKLWAGNAQAVLKAMTSNSKALRDGNSNLDQEGAVRPGYADKLFVSASNKQKPQCIAPRKHNGAFPTIAEDGRAFANGVEVTHELGYPVVVPYRGCYVNLKVTFVAGKTMKVKSGETLPNQVFAKYEAIQFLRDGEAFGSGPTSAEGFDEEEVQAGDEELF